MPAASDASRTVKHLFERMTSHTCTIYFSSGCVDYRPKRAESSIEFPPSLPVSTTHMFEFGPWFHYQMFSVTFHMSLNNLP